MFFYKKDIGEKIGSQGLFTGLDEHIRSLRPKVGQVIRLSNLEGLVIEVEVLDYDFKKGQGSYQIKKIIQTPPTSPNDLKNSKPKRQEKILIQARLEKLYLEKMIETLPIVGVTKVVIVSSDFSVSQEIKEQGADRLEAILTRSCEQCENPYKPELLIIPNKTSLIEYLESLGQKEVIVLELPEKLEKTLLKDETKKELKNLGPETANIVIAGPEGGFSKKEIEFFNKKAYKFKALDCHILPGWLAGYTYFANNL